jgi:hypothetical protein
MIDGFSVYTQQKCAASTRNAAGDEFCKFGGYPDFALSIESRKGLFREVLFAVLAEISLYQAAIGGSFEESLFDNPEQILMTA